MSTSVGAPIFSVASNETTESAAALSVPATSRKYACRLVSRFAIRSNSAIHKPLFSDCWFALCEALHPAIGHVQKVPMRVQNVLKFERVAVQQKQSVGKAPSRRNVWRMT